MTLPTLYSLQNCPYAMRARLAILLAQQQVLIRAISLKNKPADMLASSAKGTVPVLVLESAFEKDDQDQKHVIDESLDIMLWALNLNDPEDLLYAHLSPHSQKGEALAEMLAIIDDNDRQFKPNLEKYKRAKRFHHADEEDCRMQCEPFIQQLEQRLTKHNFLMGETPSLLDYALLPFIRQFSKVNRKLYLQGPYENLQRWLDYHLQSQLFSRAMFKYPLWIESQEDYILGEVRPYIKTL